MTQIHLSAVVSTDSNMNLNEGTTLITISEATFAALCYTKNTMIIPICTLVAQAAWTSLQHQLFFPWNHHRKVLRDLTRRHRKSRSLLLSVPPQKWGVFSESKADQHCLLFVLCHAPYEQLILEIRELLQYLVEQGHGITFQWLPRHCGIMGNEDASEAARSAQKDTVQEPILLPRTNAAAELRVLANHATELLRNTPSFQHTRLHWLDPCLMWSSTWTIPTWDNS